MADAHAQNQVLHTSLALEKDAVVKLEDLLASERQRVLSTQTAEHAASDELLVLQGKLRAADREIADLQRAQASLHAALDEANATAASLTRTAELAAHDSIDALRTQLESAEAQNAKLESYVVKYEKELLRTEKSLGRLRAETASLKDELKVLRTESSSKDTIARDLDRELKALASRLAQEQSENAKLEETLRKMAKNWRAYNVQLSAHLQEQGQSAASVEMAAELEHIRDELNRSLRH